VAGAASTAIWAACAGAPAVDGCRVVAVRVPCVAAPVRAAAANSGARVTRQAARITDVAFHKSIHNGQLCHVAG